ncbi:hypothetical protein K502DRAFT_300081 [Neoconidiobolus thromboides FSU 785]|nr:hypothetical protein K502DRAFT_300081 [Neoconidiobolus thromboides FSU 785]
MNDKDNLVNGYPPGAQNYPMPPYMLYGNGINAQPNYSMNMNQSLPSSVNPNLSYIQPSPQNLYQQHNPRYPIIQKNMNYPTNNPLENALLEGRPTIHSTSLSQTNGHPIHSQPQHRMLSMQQSRQSTNLANQHSGPSKHGRPTFTPEAGQWTILDLSNMRLRALSPQLFQYDFLTTLYLCNNNLNYIPAEICQLRSLVKLDLTSNNINVIPPEIGLLVNLKELYLYDNSIVGLPLEMGTLYRLKYLGLDGNPLDERYKLILATEGAPAVIGRLRDSQYEGVSPPPRIWEETEKDAKDDYEKLIVMTYNILSDRYATPSQYGYTPSWALEWEYRRNRICEEILELNADIICLQEIEAGQFDTFFKPELSKKGYDGIHWCKSRVHRMNEADKLLVDGCATFYKNDKFSLNFDKIIELGSVIDKPEFCKSTDTLNRLMNRDNVAGIVILERKEKDYKLVVANAHIHWDPECADVKLVQTALVTKELEKIAEQFNRKDSNERLKLLLCGDFNSLPDSGVYTFLDNGKIDLDHPDIAGRDYGDFCKSGLSQQLILKSAYRGLNFTNFTPTFTGVIDYIWYTPMSLTISHTLGPIDPYYCSKFVGFPNVHFPSDHIPLLIEVKIKPKSKPIYTGNNGPTFNSNSYTKNNGLLSNNKELTGSGPSTVTFNQKRTMKIQKK